MARKQSRAPIANSLQIGDDFKLIRGIGPVLANRLHEDGIHSYNELASMSPAQLAARVTGLSAKKIVQQDWLGQARKLASKRESSKSHLKETDMQPARQHYENFTIEFLLDDKNRPRRTRIVHVQSGDADTWTGWEGERLTDFLGRHTRLRISQKILTMKKNDASHRKNFKGSNSKFTHKAINPPELSQAFSPVSKLTQTSYERAYPPIEPLPVDPAEAFLPRDLKAILPGSDNPIFFVRPGQPYRVQITVDHGGFSGPVITSLMCKANIFFKQLDGSCEFVDETSSTLSLSGSTILTIDGTSLPPGIYRLSAIVMVMTGEAIPKLTAFLKGDLLQVY